MGLVLLLPCKLVNHIIITIIVVVVVVVAAAVVVVVVVVVVFVAVVCTVSTCLPPTCDALVTLFLCWAHLSNS